ncbi:phospholipase D family protein [uncultured Oxalicibacterium sp.]|uniref:phospholipase D family nuclease n=1 Tax=uncultured Oxalicibacterium sp. TaxID=1168540 RepID=UPI0034516944
MRHLLLSLWLCLSLLSSTKAAENDYAFSPTNNTRIESAFSPDAGGEQLVLKVIDAARRSLYVAAYSFTSANVARALIRAKRRGVDVKVLVDESANQRKANFAALNLLVNADIPTRTIASYTLHHDKYIVVDGKTVQTGSFNYSAAAAKSNSENVLVVWNHAQLARRYLQHWEDRWGQADVYQSVY